jgi:hypothetical protein
MLAPPKGILKAMLKLERTFLWVASDKVSSGKFKVKWDVVCHPRIWAALEIWTLRNLREPKLRLSWLW